MEPTLRRMSDALRTQWMRTLSPSSAGASGVAASAAMRMRCCFSACTCAAPAFACAQTTAFLANCMLGSCHTFTPHHVGLPIQVTSIHASLPSLVCCATDSVNF